MSPDEIGPVTPSAARHIPCFGAHIFLWVERWSDDDAARLLDRARGLGLSALEVAVGDDVTLDPAALRRRAEAAGIRVVLSPGDGWSADCDVSADDPAHRAKGVAWHARWIRAAGECGAVAYTGALYGHPGTVLRRRPPPDELPRAAEGLRRLADEAVRAGLVLALEPMSRFRTHLVNTPDQAMRLIALADHPALRVLLDTYHIVTEVRDYAAAARAAAPRLWGLHACESDRGIPGGGLVPWDALFGALAATGLPPYIILEGYNTSIGDFAFRRGVFQDLCPDGDAFVRRGLEFLRARIAAAVR
jgi:D-psicose/D-tagatose/L-ribulose 3-epimerase